MKKLLAIAVALLASLPAYAAERTVTVTNYDRVRVDGPYQVEIVSGRGASAKVIGAREAIERIDVDVEAQQLTIRTDRNGWKGGWPGEAKAGPVIIRLTTGDLREAALSGSGSLTIDRVRGAQVALLIQGAGQMSVGRVETDRLEIGLLGTGTLTVAGTTRALNAVVRGAARIEGAGLVANDLILKTESAGDVSLAAKTTAKVTSSGSGRTAIGGKPAWTVTALGSGPVTCGVPKEL